MEYRFIGLDDLERLFAALSDEELAALTRRAGFGTPVTLTVVGIGTTPDALVVDEGFEPMQLFATPALDQSDRATVRAVLGERSCASPIQRGWRTSAPPSTTSCRRSWSCTRRWTPHGPKVERAISPSAVTLLVFGLVAAVLGLLLSAKRSRDVSNSMPRTPRSWRPSERPGASGSRRR